MNLTTKMVNIPHLSYNANCTICLSMLVRVIQVQQQSSNFEWIQKFSTQVVCLEELSQCHWTNGCICLQYNHDRPFQLKHRLLHECAKCVHQVSMMAEPDFEHTRLSLPKWFAVIYLIGAGQGGISIKLLSKIVSVVWPTCLLRATVNHVLIRVSLTYS